MIRVAIIVIRNREGAYFAHLRRADKKVFPNLFGLGAGGRVEDHESAAEGAARELREETGLSATPRHREDFLFQSGEVLYTVCLFEIEYEGPIKNHDPEWSWSGFLSSDEVHALAARGQLCPDTAECLRRLTCETA